MNLHLHIYTRYFSSQTTYAVCSDVFCLEFSLDTLLDGSEMYFFSQQSTTVDGCTMNGRTDEGCRNKVKLQSQADPGNTRAVTSDDNQQVLSAERDGGLRERAMVENGGLIQMRR